MSATANTVECHLTNAYRKLGIDARDRLAGALGTARDTTWVATLLMDFA